MRGSTRRALVVVVTLIMLFLPVSAEARPRLVRPVFGLAYGNTLHGASDAELARALDDAVALRLSTVRVDLGWNDVQPDSPARWNWVGTDRIVDAARARGLSLIMVMAYAPRWAAAPSCHEATCPPADPTAIRPFAQAAARRYAGGSVLAWEIWNEQNTDGFWGPRADPAAYARLLGTAEHAVHGVDPGALVLMGGLAVADDQGGDMSAPRFLEEVASRGGLRGVSGVALHPYTFPFLPVESRLTGGPWSQIDTGPGSLRAVLARHGLGALPIWLTEYGAPTGGPGSGADGSGDPPADTTHVTEIRQARLASDAVAQVRADRGIDALVWYSDRDLSGDGSTALDHYGVRRRDGTPKPVFATLRDAVGGAR